VHDERQAAGDIQTLGSTSRVRTSERICFVVVGIEKARMKDRIGRK